MKTIKEWLNEIPEPEIREAALRNMDIEKERWYGDPIELRERETLSRAICCAFTWEDTPEGHDFWQDYENKLINENK